MSQQIKNIEKQETVLNQAQGLVLALDKLITDWETWQPQFTELMDYYGSSQWHVDRQAYNNGALEGVLCGVLSEDAIYNLYAEQRTLCFTAIRTALAYLEK